MSFGRKSHISVAVELPVHQCSLLLISRTSPEHIDRTTHHAVRACTWQSHNNWWTITCFKFLVTEGWTCCIASLALKLPIAARTANTTVVPTSTSKTMALTLAALVQGGRLRCDLERHCTQQYHTAARMGMRNARKNRTAVGDNRTEQKERTMLESNTAQ